MTPFFSIILPSYNVEKYLDRCVKSFLAQKISGLLSGFNSPLQRLTNV